MTTFQPRLRLRLVSRRKPRGWLDDAGVAAVEFALILPVLWTLIMAILDWSYYFYLCETAVNAAREGARVGVIQATEGLAASEGVSTATNYLGAAGITVGSGVNQATVEATEPSFGTPNMTVTVAIPTFTSLTGFLAPPLIPTGMSYASTMRWEMVP